MDFFEATIRSNGNITRAVVSDRFGGRIYGFIVTVSFRFDQWRRQDLLRGGAKLEMRSWGTRGELQGRVQQLLDD